MHTLAKAVIPFQSTVLYDTNALENRIYGTFSADGSVVFSDISDPSEYILSFDHDGIPFLSTELSSLSASEVQSTLIASINAYRASAGIEAVTLDMRLRDSAQAYAKKLYETRHFEHRDTDGNHVGDRALAYDYDYIYAVENLGK